jgi:hypothetical protein
LDLKRLLKADVSGAEDVEAGLGLRRLVETHRDRIRKLEAENADLEKRTAESAMLKKLKAENRELKKSVYIRIPAPTAATLAIIIWLAAVQAPCFDVPKPPTEIVPHQTEEFSHVHSLNKLSRNYMLELDRLQSLEWEDAQNGDAKYTVADSFYRYSEVVRRQSTQVRASLVYRTDFLDLEITEA